jgi:hypothetical protein
VEFVNRDAVGVVILSEDTQLECFIRRFLLKRNFDSRQIRTETLPQGRGSGEQWVREKFLNELKAYRSRSSRAATCLIVASDADEKTVEERIQTFEKMCTETGMAFRDQGERVAFIIPRRNIETWLAYLRGESVDEVKRYRKYEFESDCRDQVARLNEMCLQQKLTPEPPPSLESACNEFKRIAN